MTVGHYEEGGIQRFRPPPPPTDAQVLAQVCPACFSPAGMRCSAPTEDARRTVPWFHHSRVSRAARGREDAE